MRDVINTLWVEKYRPKKTSDIVLPDKYKEDFEIFINKKDIANLLFYGPPGSGKTTLARILTSKKGILSIPDSNCLHINGSSKETRGIGFVDSVIEPFLKIPPAGTDTCKVVFIDEADYVTDAAVHSLRAIIEKYSEYGRFIFTCNYVSKIPEAIMSRVQAYEFKQMPMDYIITFCTKILNSENITFNEQDLRYTCEGLYPDIRRIINTLQKNSLSGSLKIDKNSVLTTEKQIITSIIEIVTYMQDKKQQAKVNSIVGNMVKLLGAQDLDFRAIYNDLFYTREVIATCKIIVNKYANTHNDCLVPSMHFMAMVFELLKALKDYNEATGK